jgi:phospholipid N-methyltransferase
MNAMFTRRRSLVILCLLAVVVSGVAAAQQTPQQYQPQYAQPGKDVIWIPTSQALVDAMLDLAQVTPKDYVIDLGSGDGRTVITAAKRGARAMGIEYNPDLVALSKVTAEKEGVGGKATFMEADLFETDFSDATVITMFLLPQINLKLRPTLLNLKPGTRLVSNSFTMEDWAADKTVTITEACESWCTALLWIVPAKVEGVWQLAQGGTLTISQQFQIVSGTLGADSTSTAVAEGKLNGAEISFTVDGARYTGRVSDNVMEGSVTKGAERRSWKAVRNQSL